MSLEGSLQTIALPEVLNLLSRAAKTGELRIGGDLGSGSLQFSAGQFAGFNVDGARQPVDAVFALLRLTRGSFEFDSGVTVVPDGPLQEVGPILEEAEQRLALWEPIVAVVPSLSCWLALDDEPKAAEVSLSAAQWALVVAIGDGRSVADVLHQRELGEFEGCQSVKDLIEMGLVALSDTAPSVLAPAAAVTAPPPLLSWGVTAGEDVVIEGGDVVFQETASFEALPQETVHPETVLQDAVFQGAVVLEESQLVVGDEFGPADQDEPDFAYAETSAFTGDDHPVVPMDQGAVDPGATEDGEPAPDAPINRGLLLKFLSGVRT